MIRLHHISKVFGEKSPTTALSDVNLVIQKGELVSIVGPSGAGKSTLLNIIGGLDLPSSGDVYIDGQLLNSLDDNALTRIRREKIGFIFQFFNLLPSLTAMQNVSLPLYLSGCPKTRIEAKARQLLALLGLQGKESRLPEELSGGERQRVAIARAFSLSPPIILADEPTGTLDSHNGREIVRLILDLNSKFGTTIVVVTHNEEVAKESRRTITIRDGSIYTDWRK